MKHNLWNLIACLKNGIISKKTVISHNRKKINENLLKILWEEGYILGYSFSKKDKNKIEIFLKYDSKKNPSIKTINSISKPSKRLYYSVKNLWKLKCNNKLIVISTSKGLCNLDFCLKKNIGGEFVVCIT